MSDRPADAVHCVHTVRYRFILDDGSEEVFEVRLDERSAAMIAKPQTDPPEWARTAFTQCPHCPLDKREHEYCPSALGLASIAVRLGRLVSFDKVRLRVETEERTVSQETTAQRAICSLMGLIMATSGCPHTAFFRPMARYHLPLASEGETVYRAASMYLLAQYFVQKQGGSPDLDLEGLAEIYENVETVNATMVERLRSFGQTDSAVNAVILLDLYAKAMPSAIDESLEEIRGLFSPFLDG